MSRTIPIERGFTVCAWVVVCVLWAGSVFPALAQNSAKPHADAQSAVRVLSWNLQNYRDPLAALPDEAQRPKSQRSIETVVRVIAESAPHLLLLCEVAGAEHLRALRERLEEHDLSLPHAHCVAGPDEDRQLAVLSAFPIVAENSRGWIAFEMSGRPFYMGRGILDVTVQLRGQQPLRLVGVHLKSRRPNAFNADLIRRWEAYLLRQHLEQHVLPNGHQPLPVLVWGDFNDSPRSVVLREVAGTPRSPGYFAPVRLVDEHGTSWTHFYRASEVYSRIDHLLVNSALKPWVDEDASRVISFGDWEEASDHRPLLLELRMIRE